MVEKQDRAPGKPRGRKPDPNAKARKVERNKQTAVARRVARQAEKAALIAAGGTPIPVGTPRIYDRDQLRNCFLAYIESEEIPILAEFAYRIGMNKSQLYEMPEIADCIKLCASKKEAALERGGLLGEINVTMSIFSLKQLGWRDQPEPVASDTESLVKAMKDLSDKLPT